MKRYGGIYFIFFLYCSIQSMPLKELFINQFNIDYVSTEHFAYCALKKKPLPFDIPYVAIPWAPFITYRRLDEIPDIKVPGGFTVCQHLHYKAILPVLRKMGVSVLFATHADQDTHYKGVNYNDITVVPFPHYAMNGAQPAKIKDIYYSFIGFISHPVRKRIFSMRHLDNAYIKKRGNWHFYANHSEFSNEYKDVLARSRFSLCIRGAGVSTIRFWESLQAGAIPVLIADGMLLPDFINWDECIIRVPEKDIEKIPGILASIPFEKEQTMRKKCISIYKKHFSKENFAATIYHFFNKTMKNSSCNPSV